MSPINRAKIIIDITCEFYKMDIREKITSAKYANARMVACKIIKEFTGLDKFKIAEFLNMGAANVTFLLNRDLNEETEFDYQVIKNRYYQNIKITA